MISLRMSSNIPQVNQFLLALRVEQLPFSMSKALNATATDFQKAERAGIHQRFTIRREQWIDRSVKITQFSNKRQAPMFAEIAIAPPGSRADILGKFEDGGTKTPIRGSRLAVPDQARTSKTGIVTAANRIRAFNFKQVGSSMVFEGDKRTFMIQKPGGKGGVFQRYGRGGVLQLFSFTPSVHIGPRLQFSATAQLTIQERWPANFAEAFAEAVRTAR